MFRLIQRSTYCRQTCNFTWTKPTIDEFCSTEREIILVNIGEEINRIGRQKEILGEIMYYTVDKLRSDLSNTLEKIEDIEISDSRYAEILKLRSDVNSILETRNDMGR